MELARSQATQLKERSRLLQECDQLSKLRSRINHMALGVTKCPCCRTLLTAQLNCGK